MEELIFTEFLHQLEEDELCSSGPFLITCGKLTLRKTPNETRYAKTDKQNNVHKVLQESDRNLKLSNEASLLTDSYSEQIVQSQFNDPKTSHKKSQESCDSPVSDSGRRPLLVDTRGESVTIEEIDDSFEDSEIKDEPFVVEELEEEEEKRGEMNQRKGRVHIEELLDDIFEGTEEEEGRDDWKEDDYEHEDLENSDIKYREEGTDAIDRLKLRETRLQGTDSPATLENTQGCTLQEGAASVPSPLQQNTLEDGHPHSGSLSLPSMVDGMEEPAPTLPPKERSQAPGPAPMGLPPLTLLIILLLLSLLVCYHLAPSPSQCTESNQSCSLEGYIHLSRLT